MQFAVIWWLAVQTESAVMLTISTIVAMLPNMIVGPFAGVWVDRYNRRTVMIAADALVAFSSVILGIAFLWSRHRQFGSCTAYSFCADSETLSTDLQCRLPFRHLCQRKC